MRALAALVALLGGCGFSLGTFDCKLDEECLRADGAGQCLGGYCAFGDATCPTGLRFDETAREEFARACVDCSLVTRFYVDVDGDGHGDPTLVVTSTMDCTPPAGTSALNDDCDDRNPLAVPGGTEVCDGINNDCSSATADGCTNGCTAARRPPPDDAHLYWFCTTGMSWAASRDACADGGLHLVKIDDATENAWLVDTRTSITGGSSPVHIGANDRASEGSWVWLDQTTFWLGNAGGFPVPGRYNNWGSGEPNAGTDEHCGEMNGDGTWNDDDCPSTPNDFVCEH